MPGRGFVFGESSRGELESIESASLLHKQSRAAAGAGEAPSSSSDVSLGRRLVQFAAVVLSLVGACAVLLIVLLDNNVNVYDVSASVSGYFGGSSTDDAPRGIVVKPYGSSEDSTSSTISSKPNVIFILADDLGWNSIGHEDYDLDFTTPTLTEMSSQGIMMENYYAQEVCTPARGSLLTGRHPLSIGMQYFMVESAIPWGLELNETTIAEVMSDNGYKTHMLGKWHLGHSTPRFLPTARGFDTFTGMLNGESYYWSKRNPDHPHFKDFIASDRDCFWPYDEDDIHDYSTHQYRDMAVDIIDEHDVADPLFMYMSFQAVHDPFDDVNGVHEFGIPAEYLDGGMFAKIKSNVKGLKRQQYAMSLYIMDKAVNRIKTALQDRDMLNNTYIIFSSDNGGCHAGGGKNGPLRGTKGSLFEGGVKVDSFIYSPALLPESTRGLQYNGLFHISDWFPTVMQLANISFAPASGYELDGVSHVDAWEGDQSSESYPREHVLYNYYTNVDFYTFNMWVNGSFAVRDAQFKLMHTFNSTTYGAWYSTDSIDEDDDALDADVRCAPQAGFGDGDFTYYLFDLLADPYETTNLYDSEDAEHVAAKESLYALLPGYLDKSTELTSSMRGNQVAFQTWKRHNDFIVPWVKSSDLDLSIGGFPSDCYYEEGEDDGASDETTEEDAAAYEDTEAEAESSEVASSSSLIQPLQQTTTATSTSASSASLLAPLDSSASSASLEPPLATDSTGSTTTGAKMAARGSGKAAGKSKGKGTKGGSRSLR